MVGRIIQSEHMLRVEHFPNLVSPANFNVARRVMATSHTPNDDNASDY